MLSVKEQAIKYVIDMPENKMEYVLRTLRDLLGEKMRHETKSNLFLEMESIRGAAKVELTENGYTPEFESAILAEAEELYAAVANGTAKMYNSVEEMNAALDAED
ncbi:MAG: hypothetical protein FWH14_03855 [Oscillospiraceae bacterium]|nr:hypothetical protein [Oscillospiraceae bacterium]